MELTPGISDLFPTSSSVAGGKNNVDELGQKDFMTLMVAQLENQDPTKPMDNFQFLAQIAQFGTVSGIQELQQSFSSLSGALYANQALDAAGLIGRQVATSSNVGALSEGGVLGATVDLPNDASSVTLYVQDMNGRLVHSQAIGPMNAGEVKVQWDGTDGEGNFLPPGQYRISAEAMIRGQNQAVSVYAHHLVESITVDGGGSGLLLNLAGGIQVGMSGIRSFL